MLKVSDLLPRIAARRRSLCEHDSAVVDYTAAELECADCGAALDPWWYLRMMAREDADRRDRTTVWIKEAHDAYDKWWKDAKATADRLKEEIDAMHATANRLRNEVVGGVHVGMASIRRRKRRSP
jgi:transcription initiation factor TFIIIB Brf1 subunit/transcription initiation factor TFIIB